MLLSISAEGSQALLVFNPHASAAHDWPSMLLCQGGSWQCHPSQVQDTRVTSDSITASIIPRNWGGQQLLPDVLFEQHITLNGKVARVHFAAHFNVAEQHPLREHEIPAVFLDRSLGNLVVYTGAHPWCNEQYQCCVPGFPNK